VDKFAEPIAKTGLPVLTEVWAIVCDIQVKKWVSSRMLLPQMSPSIEASPWPFDVGKMAEYSLCLESVSYPDGW
jgi:hypothetical protein